MSYLKRITDTVIEIDPTLPTVPRPAQLDALMAEISAQLGARYGAVRLGGYWVIGTRDPVWSPVYGGHGQPQSTVLTVALAGAFDRNVIRG